jgi:hypothetical protein
LSEELNNSKINSMILRYEGFQTDPLNPWGNAFNVDIKDIKNILYNLNI